MKHAVSRRLVCFGSLSAVAAGVAGCGFQPVYMRTASGKPGVAQRDLSTVFVEIIPERPGQLLRQALQEARDEQKRADAAGQSSAREYEIANLKAQIATFQARTDELEQLRKRILALEKTNADQKQQLNDRDVAQNKVRPAIIPSY